jgi:hypothetical protein
VKNRFLLRLNNMTRSLYRRDFWPVTRRDLAVVGFVLLREWSSIPALFYIVRNLRRLLMKRRLIQSKRKVDPLEWFR